MTKEEILEMSRRENKGKDIVDIESCGGITNIPKRMQELQEQIQNTTREEELVNKVIMLRPSQLDLIQI